MLTQLNSFILTSSPTVPFVSRIIVKMLAAAPYRPADWLAVYFKLTEISLVVVGPTLGLPGCCSAQSHHLN